MSEDGKTKLSFSWARRWSAALNLLITVAAVLALVAMFNYLSIRHYTRFHLNRSAEAALSSRTREVLASLTNNLKVIVYFDSQESLFPRVKGLLKEYQYASPRIQVEYVDYMRDVAAALKVKDDYKLTADNRDVVIFDSNGNKVVASASELSDYDTADLIAGRSKEVTRTHFKGELVFTSKIYSVAAAKKTVAYYMLDNGQHAVDGDSNEGYGKFIALLNDENNFVVRPLRLIGTNEIPTDCSLLIIAGPTRPLAAVELERIQRYLQQGGRALIAFNQQTAWSAARTGLEKLLEKWNVQVGQNFVADKENSPSSSAFDVVATELGAHPIMNPIRGGRVLLFMPRSIRALKPGNGRDEDSKVDELLFTGPRSIVYVSPREIDPTLAGPKPLMAVVEKSVTGLQRGSTRIVVLGDSVLWGNNFIKNDANRDLAAATANWLVNQSVLLNGIPPRALKTYKITMTHKQMRSVQWALIAGLPCGILFIGLLVWLRRRY
jgi:ABC-2 type transport system permease protein